MAVSEVEGSFKPALLVVDMQEDFCPPVSSCSHELQKQSHGFIGWLVGNSWKPRDCAGHQ